MFSNVSRQVGWDATVPTVCMMITRLGPFAERCRSNGITPCPGTCSNCTTSLALLTLVLHSLHGVWNSEKGRGVQCVVSKFLMYFRAKKRAN